MARISKDSNNSSVCAKSCGISQCQYFSPALLLRIYNIIASFKLFIMQSYPGNLVVESTAESNLAF